MIFQYRYKTNQQEREFLKRKLRCLGLILTTLTTTNTFLTWKRSKKGRRMAAQKMTIKFHLTHSACETPNQLICKWFLWKRFFFSFFFILLIYEPFFSSFHCECDFIWLPFLCCILNCLTQDRCYNAFCFTRWCILPPFLCFLQLWYFCYGIHISFC